MHLTLICRKPAYQIVGGLSEADSARGLRPKSASERPPTKSFLQSNLTRIILTLALLVTARAATADSVSLTIVTDKGVSITAPQEWSRRLAEAQITGVRIRGGQSGEQPAIDVLDGRGSKVYQVMGVLTSGGKLLLPGAVFTLRDTTRLKDYLDQVRADGKQAVTAERGQFGLTKPQFEQVFNSLGQAIDFPTEGRPLAELTDRVGQAAGMKVVVGDGVRPTFARLSCRDNLRTLSLGCGLATALRAEGMVVTPEKPRGETVRLVVDFAHDAKESWPIGWPSKARMSELAPVMFEKINVEIDGFTLAEATDAIAPRLKMPFLWDHAALAKKRIEPAKIQVKLAPARMYYARILDRLLFQAHLRGEVRVDEAGTVFYWVTR